MRKLLAMLFALAMLLAPVVPAIGPAAAAVSDHHSGAVEPGHCQDGSADLNGHEQQPDFDTAQGCCVAMCMAVATPSGTLQIHSFAGPGPAFFALKAAPTGHLNEIATPPPKIA